MRWHIMSQLNTIAKTFTECKRDYLEGEAVLPLQRVHTVQFQ